MKTQNRMLPVAAGAILPAANTVNAFLVRNVDHSDRFGMAAVLICLVLFYKLYSMLESSDRFTFITSLFISAMICGIAKSQTTSSTGGLILPFKGMVLCVPLRHGSQHHWYYWLASLRRLIFILH